MTDNVTIKQMAEEERPYAPVVIVCILPVAMFFALITAPDNLFPLSASIFSTSNVPYASL